MAQYQLDVAKLGRRPSQRVAGRTKCRRAARTNGRCGRSSGAVTRRGSRACGRRRATCGGTPQRSARPGRRGRSSDRRQAPQRAARAVVEPPARCARPKNDAATGGCVAPTVTWEFQGAGAVRSASPLLPPGPTATERSRCMRCTWSERGPQRPDRSLPLPSIQRDARPRPRRGLARAPLGSFAPSAREPTTESRTCHAPGARTGRAVRRRARGSHAGA